MVYQSRAEPVQKDTWHDVLLAFGSNMGVDDVDPPEVIRRAVKSLIKKDVCLVVESKFYRTPAYPADAGPDFVNAVVHVRARLPAEELLELSAGVERDFKRKRQIRWGQRTLDIDVLAYDDIIFPDEATYREWREMPLEEQLERSPESLILPHPRMQDRAFVLVPMMDVAPDWRHPFDGRSTAEMLEALPKDDIAGVVEIT